MTSWRRCVPAASAIVYCRLVPGPFYASPPWQSCWSSTRRRALGLMPASCRLMMPRVTACAPGWVLAYWRPRYFSRRNTHSLYGHGVLLPWPSAQWRRRPAATGMRVTLACSTTDANAANRAGPARRRLCAAAPSWQRKHDGGRSRPRPSRLLRAAFPPFLAHHCLGTE